MARMKRVLLIWALLGVAGPNGAESLLDLAPQPGLPVTGVRRVPEGLRVSWGMEGDAESRGELFFAGTSWNGTWRGQGRGERWFSGTLTLRRSREGLALRVLLTAHRGREGPCYLQVAAPFNPAPWQRQFFPRLPYLILKPEEAATVRYLARADDATPSAGWSGIFFYPFGVLENEREFLFWGSMDLGRYCVLTPNARPRCLPCLTLRPVRIQAGQTFSFDLLLRRFPKPAYRYRDVLRWYLAHARNSDPLTAPLIRWLERPTRTTRRGVLLGGVGGLFDRAAWLPLARQYRQNGVGQLWFYGWNAWDESYPSTGVWLTESWVPLNAARVRREIRQLRTEGFRPLLYCRQFLTEEGVHRDRPPWPAWIGRNERGQPQTWGESPVPETAQRVVGAPVLHQRIADFGNEDFRRWYGSRVKACLQAFDPAGIAWDMGWANLPDWQYSQANPATANSHGMVRVQADLWQWLQAWHPDKIVIANEAPGTPSQLFAHGILIEGGTLAGKTELDYEAAKAFRTTLISYEYPDQYARRGKGVDTARYPYLAFRYRAWNIDARDDYALYLSEGLPGREGTLIRCRDLISDGEWHTLVVKTATVPEVRENKMFALEIRVAPQGDAHLWVDYIRFTDQEDGRPAAVPLPPGGGQFPLEVDLDSDEGWTLQPMWMPDPAMDAGLRVEDGVGHFWARDAGRGMKWLFTCQRELVAQELMQVMAWGACPGGGFQEGLSEIYRFAGEAMGIPLLTDSHAVEVLSGEKVAASAWAGSGRLLVAAFNAGDSSASARVRLQLPANQECPRTAQMTLLSPGGKPLGHRTVRLVRRGDRCTELEASLQGRGGVLVTAPPLFR